MLQEDDLGLDTHEFQMAVEIDIQLFEDVVKNLVRSLLEDRGLLVNQVLLKPSHPLHTASFQQVGA